MTEKLEGWTLWNFLTSILSQNVTKIEGGPFDEKKSEKKFHNDKKTGRVDPLEFFNIHSIAKRHKNRRGTL